MTFFSDTNLFFLKLDEGKLNRATQMIAFADIAKMYLKFCALFPGRKGDTYHLILRGGIACGYCVMDVPNSIFIGAPIVDAHTLERSSQWMGVALHPSTEAIMEECREVIRDFGRFDHPIYECSVPMVDEKWPKQNRNPRFAVNWIQCHPASEDLDEAKLYKKPRPIESDILGGNFNQYRWVVRDPSLPTAELVKKQKELEIMKAKTLCFAKCILCGYDSSEDYGFK